MGHLQQGPHPKKGCSLQHDEGFTAVADTSAVPGVQQRNDLNSDRYQQNGPRVPATAVLKVLPCVNLHLHPPERSPARNESRNKNASCREADTASRSEPQQRSEITLCETTSIKTLTDITPGFTYGAITGSLPRHVFGPFSRLHRQLRICQASLCRCGASPAFHLLCINKGAAASAAPRPGAAFVPLHSKFCSFESSQKNPGHNSNTA